MEHVLISEKGFRWVGEKDIKVMSKWSALCCIGGMSVARRATIFACPTREMACSRQCLFYLEAEIGVAILAT